MTWFRGDSLQDALEYAAAWVALPASGTTRVACSRSARRRWSRTSAIRWPAHGSRRQASRWSGCREESWLAAGAARERSAAPSDGSLRACRM